MSLKKTVAVLLALILALSTTVCAAESFADVAEDAYYTQAVDWAAEKGIALGKGNGAFDPDAAVSRAEAVTLLWRMAGEPTPTGDATFADVEADSNNAWYKTAAAWAAEAGVTLGTGEGFSPYTPCDRGMVLTMLYRMKGSPLDEAMKAVVPENSEDWTAEDLGNALVQSMVSAMRAEDGLVDVEEGAYYELPVIWALMNGVLDRSVIDTETLEVRPFAPCTRGETVYFLYLASGDAVILPDGAVETGTLDEAVLLDKDGVSVTATGIRAEGLNDAIVTLRVVNSTDKHLRVDAEDFFVNTYSVYPQVCCPTESEDGWVFYADAVVAPGETKDCQLRMNSLDSCGIERICELELRLKLDEVEVSEDGYDYVGDFAEGETLRLRTSLYEDGVSYDPEGTVLIEQDGLKVLLLRAENDEFSGPEITLYAYNGGERDVDLELAELTLDGKSCEGFFGMNVPVGKRCVASVSVWIEDYDNIPVAKEARLTLQTMDQETWEPDTVFAPVTVLFPEEG